MYIPYNIAVLLLINYLKILTSEIDEHLDN